MMSREAQQIEACVLRHDALIHWVVSVLISKDPPTPDEMEADLASFLRAWAEKEDLPDVETFSAEGLDFSDLKRRFGHERPKGR